MKSSDKKYICYLHFDLTDPIWSVHSTHPLSPVGSSIYPQYKVEIVKIYKSLTGYGLKECKEYVDKYFDNNKLLMKLTKEEIYQIQNKEAKDQWGNKFKLKFYFDGVESYRNNSIDEIFK